VICRVGSSIESFKPIEFGSGINIVLAEQDEGSSGKDSRNGVGKTTLIGIIHFCLGGRFDNDSSLAKPALSQAEFWIELKLEGATFAIKRAVAGERSVFVTGMPEEWILPYRAQLGLEGTVLTLNELRSILGERLFAIPRIATSSHYPTFRSLISVLIRHGQGAYLSPFTTVPQMSAAEKQIINTFLLGLGWEYAVQWQAWREKSEAVKNLKKAVKGGALSGLGGLGELEAERVKISQQYQSSTRI